MLFKEFSQRMDVIEKLSSRNEITQELALLYGSLSPQEGGQISNLLLGQLYPPYKNIKFNLAEKQVKVFVLSYLLLQNDSDRLVLEFERSLETLGDIGTAFEKVTSQCGSRAFEWDVAKTYGWLEQLAAVFGGGSVEAKKSLVLDVLSAADAYSGKYILRFILGKLRLGFSDMTILDSISVLLVGNKSLKKELEESFNVSADIGMVVENVLRSGLGKLNRFPVLGIPVRPSAAERMSNAETVFDKIGSCVAEPKIDGLRLQVHKREENGRVIVNFFSRNMLEITHMFPELAAKIATLEVQTFIAEGEVIGFDSESGAFLPFQQTSKRRRKHDVAANVESFPVRLYFFDLMFFDGQTLLDQALSKRRQLLESLFSGQEKNDIFVIEQKTLELSQTDLEGSKQESAKALKNYFASCIDQGYEGLLVKKPSGAYIAGKRNFNWIKIKKLDNHGLADTFDCVILGYYKGKGRRAAFEIGALLVGIYDPEQMIFASIAKVGTGVKDDQWFEIKAKCDEKKVATKPDNVSVAKELFPDSWILPELVVEIEADEITKSPLHRAGAKQGQSGFALRFPRLVILRFDKAASDATTTQELLSLYKSFS